MNDMPVIDVVEVTRTFGGGRTLFGRALPEIGRAHV